MTDKTCEERISAELESRLDDLRKLWNAYTDSNQECEECWGDGEVLKQTTDCQFCQDKTDTCKPGAHCASFSEEYIKCEECEGNGTLYPDGNVPDLGNMYEYGLAFDYVAPDTFRDQEEGYFRYQLSTGGPGDEFRIFAQKVNDYNFSVYRIEYWFLDWFDGASRRLYGEDRELLEEIFESFFVESGTANAQLEKAMDW